MIKIVQKEYDIIMDKTNSLIDGFPWQNKYAYMNWLAQCYYFVKHSTRLLALSSSLAPFSEEVLHKRMLKHVVEEMGHEKLVEKDIKKLGGNLTDYLELDETKSFYGNQYYYIQQKSSASFMGYILFLEGLATTKGQDILNVISSTYGINACSFVKIHSEEDQEHIKSAFTLLDSLNTKFADDIIANMKLSFSIYSQILEKIEYNICSSSRLQLIDSSMTL